jgi:predicted transcriptional regulator
MEAKRVFGELESAILQIFKANEKLTVRDALEALNNDDKYTTIMTVMNRLVEKKFLNRKRVGKQYEYSINSSNQNNHQPNFFERLKQKFFGGRSATMVNYLLGSSHDITDAELKEIELSIQKLKKSRKRSSV